MSVQGKTVQDVFTPFSATIAANSTITECAKLMEKNGLGFLLIMEGQELLGVISERDIAFKVVAKEKNPGGTLVEDIMTRTVFTVTRTESLEMAWKIMSEKGFRHQVVQESASDPTIVGVLSLRDLIT